MTDVITAARWWTMDYAYAVAWQVRAKFNRTDPASFRGGEGPPVIVLPGIYETWKFMQPIVATLHDRGHPVHVVETLQRNLRPVIEMAQRVTEYLEQNDLRDVILVAHSKGGLAGKLVMAGEAAQRVRGMIAVSTPFGGSRYARVMPIRSLRALAPDDASIMSLSRDLTVNSRIVSVYPRFDPHIPESSRLPGAKNVCLDTGGHFRILAHPRVLAEVAALAERGE
ncbi:MAG TPA: alpha/beta hydrolase [Microbacterium sp.]|nr:alpha/beta hydrolase [Microbacterium sp.]